MQKLKSLYSVVWCSKKENVTGKFVTYFSFKNNFQREKYFNLENF